jgi:tetratricopeptide (TPR) repeat protein
MARGRPYSILPTGALCRQSNATSIMQENQRARLSFTQTGLPWAIAAAALLLYLITLNRWVSLESLPYVAKVTGWDWTVPYQNPLFFLVTYPFRWLPSSWQPLSLNIFAAVCAALSLGLLARSVALLPHDRTHEQRQRERSEFSLLSIRTSWIPPVFAALVCGLELTFWEHSTAATTEMLDLLLFAYVIRCLLEYRIDGRESWLMRMALVYGLAITNNFAMIGFFPCVLAAVLWIKGMSFFEFRFVARMAAFGLLGLSLYFLLPLVWVFSDSSTVSFGQALRAHLAAQKAMLMDTPMLRTRVLILSLTSVLPLIVIGIRWPATFGDTSAAGAAFSSVMFRVVHTFFLAACIWVAFNQQFSPRALSFGMVALLSFYYLGALSIGYFTGYLLLVFGEGARTKARHRPSPLQGLLNKVVVAAVWLALIAVPAGLIYKNWESIRVTNGPMLREFAQLSTSSLPASGVVLSDDPYNLLLLSSSLTREGNLDKYILVHTRSLLSPDYHQQLTKRHPGRWTNFFTNQPPDEIIDDGSLLGLITFLSRSNQIVYLHPSFGYYFERFYLQPQGMVYGLHAYPTNVIFPPPLSAETLNKNTEFWKTNKLLAQLPKLAKADSRDGKYIGHYSSRALNYWGVTLQRQPGLDPATQLVEAGKCFQLAMELNTNNVPAQSNFDFNRSVRTRQPRTPETAKSMEDKFGQYRGWEPMMIQNGPFDHPDFCLRLGQMFAFQSLFRQSATELERVHTFEPTNVIAHAALADVFLRAQLNSQALETAAKVRAEHKSDPLPMNVDLELVRIEATAQFNLGDAAAAERTLLDAYAKHPKQPGVLDTLLQIYAQKDRLQDALATSERIIEADPERAQSFINQATLHVKQNDFDQAIASVNRILQKSPQQPQALLYKIFLLIQKKDYNAARSAIDALLNVEPQNPEALLYRGVVEIENKDFDRAIEPLSQVLKRQANNANALRNRAIAYLQLGDLAKAEKDYNTMRRVVSRDNVYVAYYGLGEIAYKREDYKNARKYYTLYLEYAPKTDSPELTEEKRMIQSRLQGMKQ